MTSTPSRNTRRRVVTARRQQVSPARATGETEQAAMERRASQAEKRLMSKRRASDVQNNSVKPKEAYSSPPPAQVRPQSAVMVETVDQMEEDNSYGNYVDARQEISSQGETNLSTVARGGQSQLQQQVIEELLRSLEGETTLLKHVIWRLETILAASREAVANLAQPSDANTKLDQMRANRVALSKEMFDLAHLIAKYE